MTQMHTYLKTTPKEYERLRLRLWLNFCESKSLTAMEWQKTLASTGYNRWFNAQVEKAEMQFIRKTKSSWEIMTRQQLIQTWKEETTYLHRLFIRQQQRTIRTSLKQIFLDSITGEELILN